MTDHAPISLALILLCGLNEALAGSLSDGVLVDAILIPPRPPIPPAN